jgi:hypothetical protein
MYTRDGAAFVWVRSGAWTMQSILSPSDASTGGHFGWSVTLTGDGNIAAVGAFTAGSVYVFLRTGTSWAQTAQWAASAPQTLAFASLGGFLFVAETGQDAISVRVIFNRLNF